MQRKLTELDRQEVKYMTRIGFVLPLLLIGIAGIINISYLLKQNSDIDKQHFMLIDLGFLILCLLISYLMNRKYFKDLKTGV